MSECPNPKPLNDAELRLCDTIRVRRVATNRFELFIGQRHEHPRSFYMSPADLRALNDEFQAIIREPDS